MENLEFVTKPL